MPKRHLTNQASILVGGCNRYIIFFCLYLRVFTPMYQTRARPIYVAKRKNESPSSTKRTWEIVSIIGCHMVQHIYGFSYGSNKSNKLWPSSQQDWNDPDSILSWDSQNRSTLHIWCLVTLKGGKAADPYYNDHLAQHATPPAIPLPSDW